MAVLSVEGLNLWYGEKQVLFDVSFQLNEREILCVVGESGSGKSSILLSVMGLLPSSARVQGKILFEGKNLLDLRGEDLRKIRGSQIAMVFQEPSAYLDPLFSVGLQVMETYEAHMGKEGAYERSIEALRKAGIPDAQDRFYMFPHQLSGGLKQRVCIASAIVCSPKVLLADEPTTALDVSVQKRILHLFRKLKEDGRSIILVTHDFGVVAEIADRVLVLREGRVVEEGSVFEIFDSPKHPYTRELLSAL